MTAPPLFYSGKLLTEVDFVRWKCGHSFFKYCQVESDQNTDSTGLLPGL